MDRTRSLQKMLLWWAYRECHNLRMVPSHYLFCWFHSKFFLIFYMHWVCMHWSEEVWVYPCPSGPLAVVGLACRLPNAYSVEHFWESLKARTNFAGKKNSSNFIAWSGRTPYDQWIASTAWTDSTKRRGMALSRWVVEPWGLGFGSFDCRCCSRPWLRLPLLEVLGTSCCQLMEHDGTNGTNGTWHNDMKSHAQNVIPRCTNGYEWIPNGIYFWCTSLVKMIYEWN